ncbi:MAG TPA: hypothetical protein VIX40_02085 [Methylomirabilota bacterium]
MSGWKRMIIHELVEYWINFAYLAFFLVAFMWYRRLILAAYQIPYTDYWVPLIEAAVLAKVIMIGDALRLGRGLENKPLVLPVAYRTAVFSVLVAVFHLLEATVRGLFHGKGPIGGLEEIASKGRYELLAFVTVLLVAFIPFFALKELDRVMGERKLWILFWTGAAPAASPSSGGTAPGEQRGGWR